MKPNKPTKGKVKKVTKDRITEIISDLWYEAGFVFEETLKRKGDRWTFLKMLEVKKQEAIMKLYGEDKD